MIDLDKYKIDYKRFLNPQVITSLSMLLFFILKTYGLLAPLGLTPDSYKELTSLVAAVLISMGIYNTK